MKETVYIANDLATGLDSIGKTSGIEVSRETVEEMKSWVEDCEYDDEDMTDIHRTREFGNVVVDREHVHGQEDMVEVVSDEDYGCVYLSDFLEI